MHKSDNSGDNGARKMGFSLNDGVEDGDHNGVVLEAISEISIMQASLLWNKTI